MDDIAEYNIARWKALAQSNAFWTRPWFDLQLEEARTIASRNGLPLDLSRKEVLLVAGGGGQHSAVFGMLGANVTVTDLSAEQLERDEAVAAHHGLAIQTQLADMRDLSEFPALTFEIVWQSYSLNFVPDVEPVFREIARILKPGGLYRVQCANPFFMGVTERDWTESGYVLRSRYTDGALIERDDPHWVYEAEYDGPSLTIPPAREYRHTLATIINALARTGFAIEHLRGVHPQRHIDAPGAPGGWHHFESFCPQFLSFLARYVGDSAQALAPHQRQVQP